MDCGFFWGVGLVVNNWEEPFVRGIRKKKQGFGPRISPKTR
jgi:hypothetical protein